MAPDEPLLRRVEQINALFVLLFTAGSWWLVDGHMALSVCLGSALISGGYFFLKHTVGRLMQTFSADQPKTKGFALKFYAHLLSMVLLLMALSMSVRLHIMGLLLGLSTITLSIFTVFCMQASLELLEKIRKRKGV
jgi:uncharacterized membrane protein